MIAQESIKRELLDDSSDAISQLLTLILPLKDDVINRVPYRDSWTAAELFSHVTKSIDAMAGALKAPGKAVERDPGMRIPELKKTFLDFSHKMKSPDFIVPDKGVFEKYAVTEGLSSAFERLKINASDADLADGVDDLPLGPITKLEILHFVVYHTQRHLRQMTKITSALRAD